MNAITTSEQRIGMGTKVRLALGPNILTRYEDTTLQCIPARRLTTKKIFGSSAFLYEQLTRKV